MTTPTLAILLAGLGFAIPHLVLGFPPLRPWLARRLGEARFVAVFSATAALGLAGMAIALATWGDSSAASSVSVPAALRAGLMILGVLGLLLAFAALSTYPRNPAALFRTRLAPPRGVEKLSRHGFFVGFGVFAAAHALCAGNPTTAMAFAVLAAVCMVGALSQDTKLRRRYGPAWQDYARATSVLPGWALLRGRVRMDADDRITRLLLRAGVVTAIFVALHPLWVIAHGAIFFGLLAVGGVFVSVRRWRAGVAVQSLA
jgi:uncharacterized membrane protein